MEKDVQVVLQNGELKIEFIIISETLQTYAEIYYYNGLFYIIRRANVKAKEDIVNVCSTLEEAKEDVRNHIKETNSND